MTRRRGSVFIITLGVVFGLMVIVATVASTVRLTDQARYNRLEAKRARVVAMSGLQYALANLQSQSTTTVGFTDNWAITGCTSYTTPGDTAYQVADGFFRVQIVDACSLVDINTASSTQLMNLPLVQEQVDSLTDWRSAGETAAADGAKDAFYNGLQNPYNAKLARLDTIDELLQVQDFTRDTIWDIPTQTTTTQLPTLPNGQQPTLASLITVDATGPTPGSGGTGGKVNVASRGGNTQQLQQQLVRLGFPANIATQIIQRRPFNSYGALFRLPGVTTQVATLMLNQLTVSAATTQEGLINVNTASQAVLQTLPNMTTDVSNAIVSGQGTALTSAASILNVGGVSVATAANFIDSVTVGSQTFLIRTVGWVGNTSVALEATVSITNGTAKIIKIVDQPFPNMDVRWNWADATTTNTLVDPSQVQTTP